MTPSDQRIPFGLRTDTGEVVDVAEVPNGAHCGCVCPACSTPLVARQGDLKVWHFAHESRGEAFRTTARECEHSLYVSLKLMSRQILVGAKSIAVPPVEVRRVLQQKRYRSEVRPARTIDIAEVEIGAVVREQPVDAAITPRVVGAATARSLLGVCLDYPGRDPITSPGDDSEFTRARCGLMVIALEAVWTQMGGNVRTFRGPLEELLLRKVVGKRWLSHPMLPKAEAAVSREIDRDLAAAAAARVEALLAAPMASVQPGWRSGGSDANWYGCKRCRVKFTTFGPRFGSSIGRTLYCLQCRDSRLVNLGPSNQGLVSGTYPWPEGA